MVRAACAALAVAVVTAVVHAPAAVAAPTGQIEYADCYTSQADACGPGKSGIPKFSDAADLVISPDGLQVYVTSPTDGSITRFDRDPATGQLTRQDCVTGTASGCGAANSAKPGLVGARAVAMSADGHSIYVASQDPSSKSIVALRREPSGALTYLGCVSQTGAGSVNCGPGNNNKDGLDTPTDLAVTADGKAVVVTGYQNNDLAYLNRDPATGAITYGGCLNAAGSAGCTPVPGAALSQPQGVDTSPDSRSVYVAAFASKALARFSRDPDSGAIAYVGANTDPSLNSANSVTASADGRNVYATTQQSTHAVSAFDRLGDTLTFRDCFDAGGVCGAGRDGFEPMLFPYGLALTADGRSVYSVHLNPPESTINHFDRDPRDGSLNRVGCFTSGMGCGPGHDVLNQIRGMMQVDASPDGRDVYAASSGAVQLVRFHRVPDQPPACSPPASVSTAAGRPVTVALGCGDPNGDAFSVGFPAGPGHGSLAPGGGSVAYTPASGFVGTDSFTVRPVDAFGVAGPVSNVAVTVAPLPDTAAPKVTGLTMPKALRAAPRGGSVLRAATAVGARVRYALSEPAATTFTVEKKTVGRRSGRRCVKATRRNRKAKRCTLYARQRGSFTRQGAAGANSFKFSGRLRNRKLAVGTYRLVAVATDAAGNKSSARRRAFRVVRR
jgi:DNA-binding beta-propeller fold protein YncE